MKKILALVLALTMFLMVGAVFAEEGDSGAEEPAAASTYSGSVTVSGLGEKDVATFYKIIEWVGEVEGNVKGWKAVSTYASVLTEAKLTEVLLGTPAHDDVPAVNPGITPELAGQLAKLAAGGQAVTVADKGTTASLSVDAPGTYMVLVKPADVNTVYNPIFVSADWETKNKTQDTSTYGDSTVKKSSLTLEKTAKTTEDAWDDKQSYSTAVGDTVSFTVKATIPAYSDVYENPHFVIKDSLVNLKLDKTSVEVTGLTAGTDYTVNPTDTSYEITFSTDYLQGLKSATLVTVTYTAKVTADAQYAINEETNEVMIEYSHDPSNETDYDVKKDTTQHYTFTIDASAAGSGDKVNGKKTSEIVKIGVKADGTPITETTETSEITTTEHWEGPLEGALFGLFTDAACENAYIPKNADGTSTGTALTATTGADGRMTFSGLDAGTYYIKELDAPDGYVTNSTPVKVVIAAIVKSVSVTEWWNGSEWVSERPTSGTAKEVTYSTEILEDYSVKVGEDQVAHYQFKNPSEANGNEINWEIAELEEHPHAFENIKGVELPSTGGIGTTIFYILGGLLVVGAVVILVARRKAQD